MTGDPSDTGDGSPLLCARCLKLLTPGRGEFFVVQIAAVNDPSPPNLDAYEIHDVELIQRGHEELVEQLSDISEQEANDQVYRKLEINLCNRCFSTWIENPAGDGE